MAFNYKPIKLDIDQKKLDEILDEAHKLAMETKDKLPKVIPVTFEDEERRVLEARRGKIEDLISMGTVPSGPSEPMRVDNELRSDIGEKLEVNPPRPHVDAETLRDQAIEISFPDGHKKTVRPMTHHPCG